MARTKTAPSDTLAGALARLYGMPAGPFAAGRSVYDDAMANYANSRSYDGPAYEGFAARYAGRDDALHAAFENGSAWSSASDAFGLFTNAVLVAVPFRHEAVWLELEAPHAVWLYAEGWSLLAPSLDGSPPGASRFLERADRSAWIRQLLPSYDQWKPRADLGGMSQARRDELLLDGAYAAWLSRADAVAPAGLRAQWRASRREGCADALHALFGAYLLDDAGLLIELLDETEGHPSSAVRAARGLLHEARWGDRDDWALGYLRARKADFLRRMRGPAAGAAAAPSEARARLGALLGGGPAARVKPELALVRDVERDEDPGAPRGWTAHSTAASGLSAREAVALVEASRATDDPVAGISVEGAGSGPAEVALLLARPSSVELRAVSVGSAPLGPVAYALAGAPHFRQQRVALAGGSVTARDLEVLGASEVRVTGVRVRDGRVGPEGFAALARGAAFSELAELVLPNSHSGEGAVEAWAAGGHTRHLRRLELVNTYSGASVERFRRGAARALLASSMPRLRRLSLGDQGVGDEGAEALGGNASIAALESLSLEGCELGADALAALVRCPGLRGLRALDLYRNVAGAGGARAVARCGALRGLAYLRLFAVGDEGAQELAGARFEALEALDLERGGLGDAGAEALAGAPWLASVRALGLDDNRVGPRGAAALASSPYARGLERLGLYQNPVGEEGVRALLALPGLKSLSAYECSVPREAAPALRALRPDVALTLGGPWSDGLNPR